MTGYDHIKNFRSLKGKLWNMSIDDLTILENKILDQQKENNEKIDLINNIIRLKENDRSEPKVF